MTLIAPRESAPSARMPGRSPRRRIAGIAVAALAFAGLAGVAPAHAAAPQPDFGPNTLVFDPTMPIDQVQAQVDAVAAKQIDSQFGTDRYALLFKPGTYGSPEKPLLIKVGYYTEVAGLGQSPGDVTINGHVDVRNQCDANGCVALNNFWRSLSNLTINVMADGRLDGCQASGNFWAVSQAAPMRRVNVTGANLTLMDYCSGPSFASGGFIADSKAGVIINGSQQQWYMRDSEVGTWTNGVWNQVFSGANGAPGQCFPSDDSCGGPYTTLASTPVSKEKPYLFVDGSGNWNVFVPGVRTNSSGTTWSAGATKGRVVPLATFFVVKPTDSVDAINHALDRGQNLIFTPGVYNVDDTIEIGRPNTIVLGLGLATLTAVDGAVPMKVEDVNGVDIAGLTIDAGEKNSPVLLEVGGGHGKEGANNPTALQDVFFRIGGPHIGKAETSLIVEGDNVILDDIWAWRADHGTGVGWTQNTADTGVVVDGNNVTATGLFVEHYQKAEVIWNGEGGKTIFFQNELPYDVPSQQAWMNDGQNGYPAYVVSNKVKTHEAWGLGSYSFFNQGIDIFAANAFEVPSRPGIKMHDMLTIFLDPSKGKGGITNVINGIGGSSTIANPDVPVTVVSFP
ncbi:MAG: adenylyl cyclase [Actinomycetes bacterium]